VVFGEFDDDDIHVNKGTSPISGGNVIIYRYGAVVSVTVTANGAIVGKSLSAT
jgi:hypothetical protein